MMIIQLSDDNSMFNRAKSLSKLVLAERDITSLKALDFGSGVGMFLYNLPAKVRHAIEVDSNSVRILKDELGVEVFSEIDQLQDIKYDVILANHSLEHLLIDQLFDCLAEFRRLLASGGSLLVAVPNGGGQVESLKKGSRTCSFEPHTIYFSLQSLAFVIFQAGFKTIKVHVGHGDSKIASNNEEFIRLDSRISLCRSNIFNNVGGYLLEAM